MMINIVLYDDMSIIRIAQRAVELFSGHRGFRTTSDTIWLNGMYLKFKPKMLILNVFESKALPEAEIIQCLKDVLLGEEVYVSDNCRVQKYIGKVDCSTELDVGMNGDRI